MLELLFPKSCAGCGAAGVSLCASCQEELRRVPHRVSCTVDPRVPVWALSPYAGAHRQLVISMKERGRRDACAYVGAAVRAAVDFLAARGELPFAVDLTLVPAPTRARSARLRGGDTVTAVCASSGLSTVPCVQHRSSVRDSVGLDAAARRRNLTEGMDLLQVPSSPVLLVDDVVTTGATVEATCAVLFSAGVEVSGVLAVCAA